MRLARENPDLSWEEIEALEGERADWQILLDKERRLFGEDWEESAERGATRRNPGESQAELNAEWWEARRGKA